MSLKEHAEKELALLGNDKEFNDEIVKIIEIFANMGHSGCSASYASQLIYNLLKFRNLTPLTGEESEWNEVTDDLFQNNRMSNIFKTSKEFNGQAYTIDGIYFSDDNGLSWFGNHRSRIPITFPYTYKEPKRVILKWWNKWYWR